MRIKPWNRTPDLLAHLRKPHGILAATILLGIVVWAVWNYLVVRHIS